jgi:hypothetical protein
MAGRSLALAGLRRAGEAADDDRRALSLVRETGDPAAEILALVVAAIVALEAVIPAAGRNWPGRPARSRPTSPAG